MSQYEAYDPVEAARLIDDIDVILGCHNDKVALIHPQTRMPQKPLAPSTDFDRPTVIVLWGSIEHLYPPPPKFKAAHLVLTRYRDNQEGEVRQVKFGFQGRTLANPWFQSAEHEQIDAIQPWMRLDAEALQAIRFLAAQALWDEERTLQFSRNLLMALH